MELTFDVLNDRLKTVSSVSILWYSLIFMREAIFFPQEKLINFLEIRTL